MRPSVLPDVGPLLALPVGALGAANREAPGDPVLLVTRRWSYRVAGTLLIGLGVLMFADRDFCGVVGGLACVVLGIVGWEASFK